MCDALSNLKLHAGNRFQVVERALYESQGGFEVLATFEDVVSEPRVPDEMRVVERADEVGHGDVHLRRNLKWIQR